MNSFYSEIKKLESDYNDTYDIKKGLIPIILTSAHGIEQKKRSGKIKFAEPYTRGIARYVSKKTSCYYLIKNEDTGIDPNKPNHDEFKTILLNIIKQNHLKLMLDLHGASKERDFDVEIGTLKGITADTAIVDKLVKCFRKCGVTRIAFNDPFKGGYITRTTYEETKINCIQLEINQNYRSIRKANNIKKICNSLIMFIEKLNYN
ncbi:N-formylglutamate amidohydrolase [Candidatus Saccharibacteria bacterium]|nr:N-formylglutamate amidohydrolase [Candidatus Saccharibacteria bacterium]